MTRHARLELYRGAGRLWYWHLRAANGRIIADGAEGYTRRRSCWRAVLTILKALGPGLIIRP